MHITSFLHEEEQAIELFMATAHSTGFFADVVPVRLREGKIRAVAFYSKDLAGVEDELEMPGIVENLSGILAHDIVIASAWDGPAAEATPFRSSYRERESVWLVRGAGRYTAGEVVAKQGELTAGTQKGPGQPPSPEGPEG